MKRLHHINSVSGAFIATIVLLPCLLHAQGVRIARGTSMVMQGGATLVLNDASLVNDGSFAAGSSTVMFTGNASKNNAFIGGISKTAFNNVLISRPYEQIVLSNDISVSGLLTMSAGNLELNNYRLDLGSTGLIMGEHINSRITGTKGGIVTATAVLNAPRNANPGNIGIELNSAANLGSTIITRGHVQQINDRGESGIHRYYDIQPSFNTSDVTLKLYYLEPELAGSSESELVLWSAGKTSGWSVAGKENNDAGTNWVAKNNISQLNRFTLGIAGQTMLVDRFVKGMGTGLRAGSIQAYPNPARNRFTVSVYSEAQQEGIVSLQDPQGRVLERRQLQYVKGMNTMQWNIAKYATGTYYLVFEGTGLGNVKIVKQ